MKVWIASRTGWSGKTEIDVYTTSFAAKTKIMSEIGKIFLNLASDYANANADSENTKEEVLTCMTTFLTETKGDVGFNQIPTKTVEEFRFALSEWTFEVYSKQVNEGIK